MRRAKIATIGTGLAAAVLLCGGAFAVAQTSSPSKTIQGARQSLSSASSGQTTAGKPAAASNPAQTSPNPMIAQASAPKKQTTTAAPPAKTAAKKLTAKQSKTPAAKTASTQSKAPAKSTAAKQKSTASAVAPKVSRRDPFSPLLNKERAGGVSPDQLPPGKPGLVIATLRLQGIVRGPNGMIAIVANPSQSVYFLREGDQLYDGRVVSIKLDEISFHEIGKDAFGKPVDRQVSKRLYPSAGE